MKNKKLQEQDTNKLPLRTQALIAVGGIQRDKLTSPIFIKNILNSAGHQAKSSGFEPDGDDYNTFYTPGTDIDLNKDVKRIRDRIRFEEYGDSFERGVEGRGFAFEGMLAGLFNGETIKGNPKEDIQVGSNYYSVKQANPGDAWDTGSLLEGYNLAYKSMLNDNIPEEDIPKTPVDLMVKGEDYLTYKTQMLVNSFLASNGQPLKWIFAHVLNGKQIEYEVLGSDELIGAILSSDCSKGTGSRACAVGQSRKSDTGLRIKSRFVLGNPKMITFPTVSEEDIKSIIYDPEGDRVEDKIRRIFKNPNKVSQYTVDYIRDNPKEFLLAVNKELPKLTNEEKKLAYNLLVETKLIIEETDVFGQGLLDPVEPEEFEGEDEEWEKLVNDVEEPEIESTYEYQGGKTDASTGYVAPSSEVTDNICKVEGFCSEQGPITFGQLRALVEEATSKRIKGDIGRGIFKSLWRIVPFFVPQILLAAVGVTVTRAFNKIITPALKDTRGYKSWWGKAVLKAMDVAEGDYIPDVALGDDPLSKIFFISDGLLEMIRDKYKLKFARYVSEYASTRPDDEPVPDWFVENLLRNYLNQKFLLDPPLPTKIDIEKYNIDESEEETTKPTKEEYEQFTKLEVTILNYISSRYKGKVIEELTHLVDTDYHEIGEEDTIKKFEDILKLFSIPTHGAKNWVVATRFAKWILDNISGARSEDFDDDSIDFGRVINPVKDWPKWYSLEGREDGWQQEYKTGEIELAGWSKDDAVNKANVSWYDYDPDMETTDWGNYEQESLDIDVDSVEDLGYIVKEDTFNVHSLSGFDGMMVKAIFTNGGGWGRAPEKFIIYLTPTGVVKDVKISGSMSPKQISFKVGDKVRLGDLIRYEKQSDFELQMVGRIHEQNKEKRINNSIKAWVDKEFNLVLDHNNVVKFLEKSTQKLNTYVQINNLVCEIWGKQHNNKLSVHDFKIKNVDIERKKHNNILFENLTNQGSKLPTDTIKHYLNKNIKLGIKGNIDDGKNINILEVQNRLVKLGFIKENQPKQKIILEWLNDVIKETNKNGVITEEGDIKYVDNIIETTREIPHGLGVPLEIFLRAVETLKSDMLKDLKPHINEFMYYCLGFEEMKPEDSEDWYSMGREEGFDVLIHRAGYSPFETVEDVLSDSCSGAYNSIWDLMRGLETTLQNMGILEPSVKMENGEKVVVYYEDKLPESLVNLYTQMYSEIDQRLKSDWSGMPMANKKAGGETKLLGLGEDSPRAHSYSGGRHSNPQEVEVGDIIRLIHMDDPQGIAVGTYGKVVGFDTDPWEKRILVTWELANGKTRNLPLYPSIDTFMMDNKPNPINEQEEQLNLFPTGQFMFTANEDQSDAKWLEKTVTDRIIKLLFKKWNEDGMDIGMFKYLGIPSSSLVIKYVVKRYIQNTSKPIPVSTTFDCDELKDLFGTESRGYDTKGDWIENYLCGKDEFWEPSEWFQYEWYDGMLDDLDEDNWKTISSIFGGLSQSVSENLINDTPQNEDEEGLIEKYEEEISDIKHFITWANNDVHEDAVKSAMADDLKDKINEHFDYTGKLMRDGDGSFNYIIEGDLRDYVNDQWDNTETFQYHPEFNSGTVLEEVIESYVESGRFITNIENILFMNLMQEEYNFFDYCEGKKGECLEPETKFFDGYWYPSYDINEVVADRLQELTYEPQVTTPEGETKPLNENQNIPHWDLYQLLKKTSNVNNHRRKKVFDFLNVLQNLGLVNMYQSPDFLWSGSKWLTKYLDLYHPELLEEPDELLDFPGDLDNERIQQARYLLDNADTVRDTVLMMLIESTEDQDSIKVETQMRPFAADLFKLWARIK